MRAVLVAIALVCVCASALVYSPPSSALFLYSGKQFFTHHVNGAELMQSSDLQTLLGRIVKADQADFANKQFVALTNQAPEVVLAFVNTRIGAGASSAGQLGSLKSVISGAASSLSVPYLVADSGASVSELLPAAVKSVSPAAKVMTAQLSTPADCDAVLSQIGEFDVFGNGATDLVLVKSSDVAVTDACIKRVSDKVAELSSGNFVGLFSADAATPRIATSFSEGVAVSASSLLETSGKLGVQAVSSQTAGQGPQYITSAILIGLLVAFMLLGVALCGVSQLMAIQAPVRFSTQRLQLGKEY